MQKLRGAFGPAELIFLAGLVSLAIGLGVLLPAAAFIAVGLILLGVGWRWQQPPKSESEPTSAGEPVDRRAFYATLAEKASDRETAMAERGFLRPA